MTRHEGEVELAPGIYLTKRVSNNSSAISTKEVETEGAELKHREYLEQHPKDHYEWIKVQINRIENSLSKLSYSNKEMLAIDAADPDFVEAVEENIIIMEKQRKIVDEYKKKARELAASLGVCFQELEIKPFEKPSQGMIEEDEESPEGVEGVYL